MARKAAESTTEYFNSGGTKAVAQKAEVDDLLTELLNSVSRIIPSYEDWHWEREKQKETKLGELRDQLRFGAALLTHLETSPDLCLHICTQVRNTKSSLNFLLSQFKNGRAEASVVTQWVKPQPIVLAPHMGAGLSLGCATVDPTSCSCWWEDNTSWPMFLDQLPKWETQMKLPQLWTAQPANVTIWGVNQQVNSLLSLNLPFK